MDCPKCNKPMEKDNRASSKKREVWICLWENCGHHVLVPILDKDEKIEQLQAELDKLKEFAQYIIRTECWSMEEQDGCEIQDLAERLGLIQQHIATEEDVDDEGDFDVGDMIYKFSGFMKGGE